MQTSLSSQPWLEIAKASRRETAEVKRQLDLQLTTLAPAIRREFLAAISSIQDKLSIEVITELLRQGKITQAIQTVDHVLAVQTGGFAGLSDRVIEGMWQAAREVPMIKEGTVTFMEGNPAARMFAQRYRMNLIRELTREARANVRSVIEDGLERGRNPREVARTVRQHIGLTRRQSAAVRNFRRMLEQNDAEVFTRQLRNRTFDRTIRRVIRDDIALSKPQIDKMVERYEQRYLNYRATTIARTESMRALNAANHLAWNQAAEQGRIDGERVQRIWIYTHDDRTRDAHRATPGMNPDGVGLNEPFETPLGPLMYPGDPAGVPENTINCRCTVIYKIRV